MRNPNELDLTEWGEGVADLGNAIRRLWASGATLSDLQDAFEAAIETTLDCKAAVHLTTAPKVGV